MPISWLFVLLIWAYGVHPLQKFYREAMTHLSHIIMNLLCYLRHFQAKLLRNLTKIVTRKQEQVKTLGSRRSLASGHGSRLRLARA